MHIIHIIINKNQKINNIICCICYQYCSMLHFVCCICYQYCSMLHFKRPWFVNEILLFAFVLKKVSKLQTISLVATYNSDMHTAIKKKSTGKLFLQRN